MNGALTTQVRDKLILLTLLILGIGCLIGIFVGRDLKYEFGLILMGLGTMYKGNPSTAAVSPTASTTSSTETKTSETVTDDKKNEPGVSQR